MTEIKAALADFNDTELAGLIAVTYTVPQTAPRLLAWIDCVLARPLGRAGRYDWLWPFSDVESERDQFDRRRSQFDPEQPLDLLHSGRPGAIFGQRLR